MIKILSTRRLSNFWQLVRQWFKWQFSALERKIESISVSVESLDMEECTSREVRLMFVRKDKKTGLYKVPAGLLPERDYITVQEFEELTGLTPVE